MKYLLLALLPACATPQTSFDAPQVTLYVNGPDAEAALAGGDVWEPLGFWVELEDPSVDPLTQCPYDWYELGDVDCEISVVVEYAPAEELGPGVLGRTLREFRRVWVLDTIVDPDTIAKVISHEVGHVALDTGEHLAAGAGVMAVSRPTPTLTAGDRALACRAIDFCP